MIQVEHLKGSAVSAGDWALLRHALETDYAGHSIADLAQDLDRGVAQLWLILGPKTRVLLVTQIAVEPAGKELFIRYTAGFGWFRHFDQIEGALIGLAQSFGCRFISGRVRGKVAGLWYKIFKALPQGLHVTRDLYADGQQENNDDSNDDSLRAVETGARLQSVTRH